jgi:hypothetical protein
MKLLTLRQLAARVCPKGGDPAGTRERIRHWARSGVLLPLNKNPGQGGSRMFAPEAIIEAAVLNALEDIPGTSVLALGREPLFALAVAKEEARQWLRDGKPRWLELSWWKHGASLKCTAHIHSKPNAFQRDTYASIILPLHIAFASVGWSKSDEAAEEPQKERKSSRRAAA